MADTEAGGLGTVLPVCGDYLGAAEATRCTVIERASRFTRPAPAGVLARREQFGHRTWKKLREKCSQPPLGAPTCVTVPAGDGRSCEESRMGHLSMWNRSQGAHRAVLSGKAKIAAAAPCRAWPTEAGRRRWVRRARSRGTPTSR